MVRTGVVPAAPFKSLPRFLVSAKHYELRVFLPSEHFSPVAVGLDGRGRIVR